jgi:hypothetical protein
VPFVLRHFASLQEYCFIKKQTASGPLVLGLVGAKCSTGHSGETPLAKQLLSTSGGSWLIHSNLTELGGTISYTNVDTRRRGLTSDGPNTV